MPDVIAHVRAIDYFIIRYHSRESHSYLCALVLDLANYGLYRLSYYFEPWQGFMLNGASLADDTSRVDVDNSPFYGRASDVNTQD